MHIERTMPTKIALPSLRRPNWAHQDELFDRHHNQRVFPMLMDRGTGKTKATIDLACYLYTTGQIDAVIVAAPNGVHLNWPTIELLEHHWLDVPYRAAVWKSPSQLRKKDKEALVELADPEFVGLRWLFINIEALSPQTYPRIRKGVRLPDKNTAVIQLTRFMQMFRTLFTLDEATRIKNHAASRSKRAVDLAEHAQWKRILTGTAITNSPLDAYMQFNFLDWRILGYKSFFAFRNRYAIVVQRQNPVTGRNFDMVVSYQNLDELKQKIADASFIVRKSECLDLPDKIYNTLVFEMNPKQRQLYDQMRLKAIAIFNDKLLTAKTVLAQVTRLSQICGGFFPTEGEELGEAIPGPNPKLNALLEALEDIYIGDERVVIWARYRAELFAIRAAIHDRFGSESYACWWGDIDVDSRVQGAARLQDVTSTCRFMIAQPRSGGYGNTWTGASITYYYSNSLSLEDRLQSEDRTHRGEQKRTCTYTDMLMLDSTDEKIVKALRSNQRVSDYIMGHRDSI